MKLGPISVDHLRLRLEIAVWRFGWIWILTLVLFMASLAVTFWARPQMQVRLLDGERQSAALEKIRSARAAAASQPDAPSGDEVAFRTLMDATYSDAELNIAIRRVYSIAAAQGLNVPQSDFKTVFEAPSGLRQVQMTLPLQATYSQLRNFVLAVLQQESGISVDLVQMKRASISMTEVEAQVQLSVWVNPEKPDIEDRLNLRSSLRIEPRSLGKSSSLGDTP